MGAALTGWYELRPCGRATTSGKPCRARIHGQEQACRTHATPDDHRVAQLVATAFDVGRTIGKELAESSATNRARAEYETRDCRHVRTHDERGAQIVQVNGYAYVWRGDEPLAIGDRVEVPGGRDVWNSSPWVGVVTKLGSDYVGSLRDVIRRARETST